MISVLLTTYNDENSLKYSIVSILRQTFKDFELLIVDDGSTDNTTDIINGFNDERITYKKINHLGRSCALNYGLKYAKNDWILIADADDIMYPNKLELFSRHTDKTNRVIWGNSYFFNNSRVIFKIKHPHSSVNINRLFALHSLNNFALFNRKHVFHYSEGYDESLNIAEDYDFWLKILPYSEFIVIPDFVNLICYWQRSFSRKDIKNTQKEVYKIQYRIYNNHKELLKLGYSEDELLELRAWREFFFGDKVKARNYFLSPKFTMLKKGRVMIAILLTYFSEDFLIKFKSYILKYRIFYLLTFFSKNSKNARKLLRKFFPQIRIRNWLLN